MGKVVEHSLKDCDILGTNPSHDNIYLADLRVSDEKHPLQTTNKQKATVAESVEYMSIVLEVAAKDRENAGSNLVRSA